uniref:RNA-directed DNA polymerase n=1 Tax=Trichuris muris TaxID=70415 RepID=A0A5S6Q9K0_TRIMR
MTQVCEALSPSYAPEVIVGDGSLHPPGFLQTGANVKLWLQRFEDYALDAGIAAERWSAAVMSRLSDELYATARDNGFSRQSTFQALSAFLESKLAHSESAIERYLAFQKRKQGRDEPAQHFGDAIRSLGRQAGIETDQVLRDHFITGLSSYKVTERLLHNLPQTFDEAVNHARRVEEAEVALRAMSISRHSSYRESEAHYIISRQEATSSMQQRGNVPTDRNCWNCGRPGHLRAARRRFPMALKSLAVTSLVKAPPIYCTLIEWLGAVTILHRAFIVDGIPLRCVIGADFLLQHGCVVDVKGRSLMVGGYSVPMRYGAPDEKTSKVSVSANDAFKGAKGEPGVCSALMATEQCDESFQCLLREYADIFADGENLGRTDVVQHRIDTGDAEPRRQPPRRIPFHQRKIVEQETQRMLRQGIIEPAEGPWASSIVLVRKKDGTFRFCVDYRKLNDVTRKDAHPLPRIDDTLESLGGARWFSTLDLASGFWQVSVHPKDRPKTAFCTPTGLYQFKVMPFGLCNAPSTFQRLMEAILTGLQWATCLVYLDDIIVYSRSKAEHMQSLCELFSRLRKAGLKLKMEKCHFFKREVKYLGHVVSRDGIRADSAKTEAVNNWPKPTSPKELRQFLGLASYYRRFVPSFATIAAPLHKLLTKSSQWSWTSECEASFSSLKAHLTSAPTLPFPDFSLPFILDTDASNTGLGAVLAQNIAGQERVIAYASRSMSKAGRKYSTTRQEMLALVWAVKQFRPYLYGSRFVVRTDHNSLRWLQNFKEPEGQVARWLELLANFDFSVEHRAGSKHANADSLSRMPNGHCPSQRNCVAVVNHLVKLRSWLQDVDREDMLRAQQSDPDIGAVYEWVEKGVWPGQSPPGASRVLRHLWCQADQFSIRDGLLCRRWISAAAVGNSVSKWLLVVPRCLIPRLLEAAHDGQAGGHIGFRKTFEKVRSSFYWPNQREDVANWCSSWDACARRKPGESRRARAPLQPHCTGNPWERICLDFLGPFTETTDGNRYLLVVTDSFTKWTEAFPVKDMEAKTTATVLVSECFCRYGLPEEILTDQGRNFVSALMESVYTLLDIRKLRTSAYHAQSNGQVERFNRTLLTMLSITAEERPYDWDEQVPLQLLAYRTSVHSSTGMTPFQAMFGREARLPADIMYGPLPEGPRQVDMHTYASDLRQNLETA